ncbi:myosin heavy chain, muscle-like [Penaeus chinensis]|uniref:myosin heavy chain, muscle-like n=1 Tax=Penaeus chinensis TaxID=139456 RepID=UPI001FB786AF|nr:myosin heavy chain, muscle-like [Penaeus chinensis]
MPGHLVKSTGPDPDPSEWLYVSAEQRMLDQTKPYDPKKSCWVPDDKEGFLEGLIQGTKGDSMVSVQLKSGEVKNYKKDVVGQVNPPKYEKADDMSNLTYLNDASVLYNLKTRYQAKLIYTYSGLFCIAVNPYKRFPIYTNRTVKIYQGKRRNEVPPHLFAISDGAYMDMLQSGTNQSMLITGESGAGKTENTKKVLSYFANVGATTKKKDDENKPNLEDQIVQTNPPLEAYGNAKTTRNDNSSRFGKFIRIHFAPNGKLSGADIEVYLLEKARVISQQAAERGYHIFYQMMSDQVPYMKKICCLTDDIYDYNYVAQGKVTVPSIDDKEDMEFTHNAFSILNFTDQERDDAYRLTASVMHMGNLKFKQRGREEQAEPDGTEAGDTLGEVFGVDSAELYKNLCKPKIKVGAEFVTQGRNVNQVNYSVGALAKALFDRLFKWIVKKCNQTLETGMKRAMFIGVLDIAGFEIFDYNGFEQICINFCNEKLQQFFNHHMFVLEQEEYKSEGINWQFVDFGMDLQACIELFEKKLGLLAILEEESMFPKATDKTFEEKLKANHLGKSPCLIKPKPPKPGQAEGHFAIVHYAGTVTYNLSGWLEKNKDPLNDTVVDQLKKASNQLLVLCFADHPGQSGDAGGGKGKGGKGGKKGSTGFKTVSSGYRDQLNSLMTTLHSTHPHFIRCIVPNETKTPGAVQAGLIMHQLTCNGVLEGIRICRKGFPNRMPYQDFKHRYKILAPEIMISEKDDKKAAEKTFEKSGLDPELFRCGKTKNAFSILNFTDQERDDAYRLTASVMHMGNLKFKQRGREEQAEPDGTEAGDTLGEVFGVDSAELYKNLCKPKIKVGAEFVTQGRNVNQVNYSVGALAKALFDRLFKWIVKKCNQTLETGMKRAMFIGVLDIAGFEIFDYNGFEQICINFCNEKLQQFFNHHMFVLEQEEYKSEGINWQFVDFGMDLQACIELFEKAMADKTNKQIQQQINDVNSRLDEANRNLNDFDAHKKKLAIENSDLLRQLEEIEGQISQLNNIKVSLTTQLDDTKKIVEDEARERSSLLGKFRNLEHDLDGLREQLDEETEGKADANRLLSKANAEAHMWRSKYEAEGVARAEEIEAARLKLAARLEEAELQIEQLNVKNLQMEKAKGRVLSDIEEMQLQVERAQGLAIAAEKNQKNFDRVVNEWKVKVDDLAVELDASQKECRQYSTEHFRIKAMFEENLEHLDAVRRENKSLADEIKDLMEQISEGGRSLHEIEKNAKRFEIEKEELQAALEEAEVALEQEENKVLRGQLELSQVRQEIEKRIQEKEEEFDATRKTHQRAIDSMQASLEAEAKSKAEALRMKKKLESDINELEIALDQSNKANADIQKAVKKAQLELKDMQARIEEEQLVASEYREQASASERKANAVNGELEESRTLLEQSDRARRQAESELADSNESLSHLSAQHGSLSMAKRKLEGEMQTLHADLDDMLNESKNSEDKSKKAMVDAARLADELRAEQEHAQNLEKIRRGLEVSVKELQGRLEECEANAHKTGKKALAKLETRIRELESQFDDEARRHADAQKNLRKCERRIKELSFQSDEDKKNHERMQDLVDKLQQKIKTYKRQIEEAEEIAALNLAKYRKAQQELEGARN